MLKQKMKKMICISLAAACMLGASACSGGKASAANLRSAALKIGATEYETKKLFKMSEKKRDKALKDGVVVTGDSGDVEYVLRQTEVGESIEEAKYELRYALGIRTSILDSDEISEATVYVKHEEERESFYRYNSTEFAAVLEYMDMEDASKAFDDFFEAMEEYADDEYDLDVSDLETKEYMRGERSGHAIFHMSPDLVQEISEQEYEEFRKLFSKKDRKASGMDGTYEEYLDSMSKKEREQYEEGLEKRETVAAVYYNNGTLTVLYAVGGESIDRIDSLAGKMGLTKPSSIENSEEVRDFVKKQIRDSYD
ncbi:MAG: hypothetical protein J6Y58_03850 [Clostridiales bacterium]|nr:hypothetical protein [Clostridiales bacterium]